MNSMNMGGAASRAGAEVVEHTMAEEATHIAEQLTQHGAEELVEIEAKGGSQL